VKILHTVLGGYFFDSHCKQFVFVFAYFNNVFCLPVFSLMTAMIQIIKKW